MKDKILTKRLIKETSPTMHWLQKPAVMIVIALLGLALVLGLMMMNINKYETHLATGDTVLLALAPVDPRGFMQGDYMTLSYALEPDVFAALRPETRERNLESLESLQPDFRIYKPSDGYVIVKTDSNNVGQFVRLAKTNSRDDLNSLAVNELAIHYRIRNGSVQVATNAFFFQEGHAKSFEAAQYGLFRVNAKGEPLLTEMVNDKFQIIKGVDVEDKAELADDSSH
ncbi:MULTISPECIES: GDYXXLXY domain-containing protein [unclassified Psychrobacter]|uniref:GDYXXLXY domain-containing protein n=1 Tax=unclassified Psychrobacter TaxID=196806 RepID=UPI001CE477BA|nr:MULTISPECIES: GDYXXLXY domain-containing protein [unclassified Psychrobacter]MDN5802691.1 GDYXXLXY domain-containing protein [Psychrobacter sp.]MDN5891842.1 GDYXXLXY domain-containing protein [Psychrobacter sp.]MDN5897806.1 GDYXXLXY domain-containing protein [Psychrobacter sp.]